MVNGVDASGAGFVVTGTTVTAVGTVPPKLSVVAGRAAVAGVVAVESPVERVITLEFGAVPEATLAN